MWLTMPSTSRPRSYTSGPNGSGRAAPNAPMSERQQMALVMQMHTSTQSNQSNQSQAGKKFSVNGQRIQQTNWLAWFVPIELSPGGNPGPSRSRDRNERGETILHTAAIKGDQETVKKQLEQGTNPNIVDFAGKYQCECSNCALNWVFTLLW